MRQNRAEIAELIRERLRELGWSLEQLADRMGTTKMTVSRMLRGENVGEVYFVAAKHELGLGGRVTPEQRKVLADLAELRDRSQDVQEALEALIAILVAHERRRPPPV